MGRKKDSISVKNMALVAIVLALVVGVSLFVYDVSLSSFYINKPKRDALLMAGHWNGDYEDDRQTGSNPILRIGRDYNFNYRSIIEFDLKRLTIPDDFINVRLLVHTMPIEVRDQKLTIYCTNDEWDEELVTWATQPSKGRKLGEIIVNKDQKDVWLVVDLDVAFIKEYIADGNDKLNVLLFGIENEDRVTTTWFYSIEKDITKSARLEFITAEDYGYLSATVLVDNEEDETATVMANGEKYSVGELIFLKVGTYEVSCEKFGKIQKELIEIEADRTSDVEFSFETPKIGILEIHTYLEEKGNTEETNLDLKIVSEEGTIETVSPVYRELLIGNYRIKAIYNSNQKAKNAIVSENETTEVDFYFNKVTPSIPPTNVWDQLQSVWQRLMDWWQSLFSFK